MSAKTAALATALLLCGFCLEVRGDTTVADEYEIKAAMLANVFRLVDWPPGRSGDASAPFVVGIVSSDEMESALSHTVAKLGASKTASGQPVSIRRISGTEGIDQCHVIFIGGSDRKRVQAVLQAAGSQPVLTVGESDKFTDSGGIVSLVVKDDRVQVEVNLAAARSAGLSISSRLLRIASIRGGGTP